MENVVEEKICRNCNLGNLMVFQNDEYVCRADRYMRCYSGSHVCHREDDFVVRRNCTRRNYVIE